MSGRLAVVDLESHRLLATGLDPERAREIAADLDPRYVLLDEPTYEVLRDRWDHPEVAASPARS